MSSFNYRASFANSTSRLTEVVMNLMKVEAKDIPAEMVAIAACSTLKGVEGKTVALALIIAKWLESDAGASILNQFDFSKVEFHLIPEKKAETLLTCAKQAYAVRQWATLTVKVKA